MKLLNRLLDTHGFGVLFGFALVNLAFVFYDAAVGHWDMAAFSLFAAIVCGIVAVTK